MSAHPGKRPGRRAFPGEYAAYGAYTLPTMECELFIAMLVAHRLREERGRRKRRERNQRSGGSLVCQDRRLARQPQGNVARMGH